MIVMDHITFPPVRTAALAMRAINHGLRQKIIELIEAESSINVTDIYTRLRIEQSVASQHLAILRQVGIVKTDREGKEIYYSIDYDRLDYIIEIAAEMNEQITLQERKTYA